MSERLLIRGGTVIDPAQGYNGPGDVLVDNGVIAAVGQNLGADGAKVIDASGFIVAPGFVDMHVHLREPGEEYKEDIASGTRAAAAGGFTSVVCMANTRPPIDTEGLVRFVRERARTAGVVNVYPVAALTRGLEGKELTEAGSLRAAGAVALSDDGHPVADAELMRAAVQYAAMFALPVIDHCQDPSLSAGGVMHQGYWSTVLGLRGQPGEAEALQVARDVMLARLTGAHIHIAHVSSRYSVELIRRAKAEGLNITAEVTPHHLVLTDAIVNDMGYDTNTKTNPPVREEADRRALREALRDGVIDAVATDHAPHHQDDKLVEYDYAAPGIVGLETAVGLLNTELVETGWLDWERLVKAMSLAPARMLGLRRGTLGVGEVADITVIDPSYRWVVDPHRFYSKSRNTPFAGRSLVGRAHMTIVAGHVVMQEGRVLE